MDAARTGMGRACWERRTRRAGQAGGQRPKGGQNELCRAGRETEAPGRAERAVWGRPGAGVPAWLIEYREGKR